MNMNGKILFKLINKSLSRKEFSKQKKILLQSINENTVYLPKNIKLDVILRKQSDDVDSGIAGLTFYNKGVFSVSLYPVLFSAINSGGMLYLPMILQHEFNHVYNIYHTLYNPFCSFIPDSDYDSLENYYKKIGFDFWVEFVAFRQQFYYYNFESGLPTVFQFI